MNIIWLVKSKITTSFKSFRSNLDDAGNTRISLIFFKYKRSHHHVQYSNFTAVKMKLIVYALTLISISLSLSSGEDDIKILNPSHYLLSLQKYRIENEILNALSKCNQTNHYNCFKILHLV